MEDLVNRENKSLIPGLQLFDNYTTCIVNFATIYFLLKMAIVDKVQDVEIEPALVHRHRMIYPPFCMV